jgi:hypothetical protein
MVLQLLGQGGVIGFATGRGGPIAANEKPLGYFVAFHLCAAKF